MTSTSVWFVRCDHRSGARAPHARVFGRLLAPCSRRGIKTLAPGERRWAGLVSAEELPKDRLPAEPVTLQRFLARTAGRTDGAIRPAMVEALKVEVPRSREAYARFYSRVIAELVRPRPGLHASGDAEYGADDSRVVGSG